MELKFLGRCSLASGTHLHKNKFKNKLSNANKIVMLSQTHGYNQFVRFPETVKSVNFAGSF